MGSVMSVVAGSPQPALPVVVGGANAVLTVLDLLS